MFIHICGPFLAAYYHKLSQFDLDKDIFTLNIVLNIGLYFLFNILIIAAGRQMEWKPPEKSGFEDCTYSHRNESF